MSKMINFKPGLKPATPDEWVQGARAADREAPALSIATTAPAPASEAMKRFTIDGPVQLHTRIKTECARRGVKMVEVLREMLEREFPET